MLIALFSLGRTAEALRAIIGSKSAISLQRSTNFCLQLSHFSSYFLTTGEIFRMRFKN